MNRLLAIISIAVFAVLLSGCGFATYAPLPVSVVDQHTRRGIPNAEVETLYVKPMLDPTYQRKDRKRTDQNGAATLTVATNDSQWFIFGSTYGISPHLSVTASGYHQRDVQVPRTAFKQVGPFTVELSPATPNHALQRTEASR